ncbi:SAM-dependent methyltransferase [Frankia canadensis]|uniref:SAM-dependent methyltransferase n=1 Tax=Frankia canadensis TaxID=1836972 RepID=UPI001FAEE0CF|nr:SAM-dependent methyltransferase [Frankia canadensis]
MCLLSLLHHVSDEDDPHGIVAHLMDALPPGSHLALTHVTGDFLPAATTARGIALYRARGIPVQPRTRASIARFFDGLELLEPGLVPVQRWRPAPGVVPVADAAAGGYGAVARKA